MTKKSSPKLWFYAVLILIPVTFFILLEGVLRIFNYGNDYTTFVELEEISSGEYFLNPELPKKYFSSTQAIPSVIPDAFDINKKENTIRVFVFGGSTVAGYPYSPNASFPRRIKHKLEMFYPEYRIEVINLGVSAVNTYFIYDILPDVISQKPDLLIFYTGHNEYYGALGPASSEYFSSSSAAVRAILFLRELKIYQLVNELMRTVTDIFSEKEIAKRSTLMKEMIEEQEVIYDSEIFNEGLEQYRKNMHDIITKCNEVKVPVIVGNLVSNLMQEPLSSNDKNAIENFKNAQRLLENSKLDSALSMFTKAKDLDALRFRAPEDFNEVLLDLSFENDFTLVDLKNKFEKNSINSITGFDLMIDHLHPNLDGYKLMAEVIYESADSILNQQFDKAVNVNEDAIDNYLKNNFPFTRYDSTLAEIKIQILLNDFPFKTESNFSLASFELNTFADTLAMETVTQGLGWASAHLKLFDHYFMNKKYSHAAKELFALLEDRPFYKSALRYGVPKLISAGYTREAKHILVRNHRRYPDGFTSKELGIINLDEGNIKLANKLLKEALNSASADAETFFHLSRSYFAMDNIDAAIESMKSCLNISPNYPEAKKIYEHLKSLKKDKK